MNARLALPFAIVLVSNVAVVAGCTPYVVPGADKSLAVPFLLRIDSEGWAKVEVPICEGDEDVTVGVSSNAADNARIWHGWNGPRPVGLRTDDWAVEFEINPVTLARLSLNEGVPLEREAVPYSSLPDSLAEAGGFYVHTSRGVVEFEFKDLPSLQKGDWMYRPNDDPKLEGFYSLTEDDIAIIDSHCDAQED